jgi:hypothetical protein
MTHHDWHAVSRLFATARDLGVPEREQLLSSPWLEPALVAEVRSLLAHADDPEFLSQPAPLDALGRGR